MRAKVKKKQLCSDSIIVKPFWPGSKTIDITGVHAPVIDRVCWNMSMILGFNNDSSSQQLCFWALDE